MNHSTSSKGFALVALLAALGLSGCGGGGGSSGSVGATAAATPADATVPASAGVSTQALVEFSRSQSADDTAEPFQVKGFAPPTDDTAEPNLIR
ncbi:MAG: hypothetical protein ABIQ60_14915 [Burkholderiaceae bacterium]